MILLISFSINPKSKSYKAINNAHNYLKSIHIDSELIDMRKYELPFYDGTDEVLNNETVKKLFNNFSKAEKIIIGSPIYNFVVNAVLKNFIDLLSVMRYRHKSNKKQIIGVIGAMGNKKSFASLLPSLSNFQFSLGLYLIPKIVMCTPKDFDEKDEVNIDLENRIIELCNTMVNHIVN